MDNEITLVSCEEWEVCVDNCNARRVIVGEFKRAVLYAVRDCSEAMSILSPTIGIHPHLSGVQTVRYVVTDEAGVTLLDSTVNNGDPDWLSPMVDFSDCPNQVVTVTMTITDVCGVESETVGTVLVMCCNTNNCDTICGGYVMCGGDCVKLSCV